MTRGDGHRSSITRIALILATAAVVACRDASPPSPARSSITFPVTPIAACPEGAERVGDAPPKGFRQRCQKSEIERHGASREWYEDGRERSYSEWWNGEKHGRFTLWFKNGRVRSQGAHRHGAPAGEWSYYQEDGTLQQHQRFPVSPPPADWLAQALAGHPPAAGDTAAGAPTGERDQGDTPPGAAPSDVGSGHSPARAPAAPAR